MAKRDFTQIAHTWEEGVLSGKELVGELVRRAVQRQRADLDSPPAGYVFDAEAADKACALAEQLAFPKGKKRGQRFKLEPWQVWNLRCLFGWVDPVSGTPRFTRVTEFICKGNGKSPLAALIGLIVIARGKAIGAKVYSAATTQKQACNVFEPAQEMLRLSPDVQRAAGLVVCEHIIKGIGDNRTFEPISAEKRSADGSVGDVYIVDEVHQHPNRSLYDTLANNASKVEGSRLVVISTAGTDQSPTSIGWILYQEARDVLLGKADQPNHFAFIVEADRKLPDGSPADPWSERTWKQANLNWGVSVSPAGFKALADSVRKDPGGQAHFFATRLGWWSKGASKWMDLNAWDAAAREITEEDFQGKAVFLGLDYAPKLDLSAKVRVGVSLREDGQRSYVVGSLGYAPAESPTLRDNPEFLTWAPEWLTPIPGTVISAAQLRPEIVADVERFRAEVCLDPFGAVELMSSLPAEGITPVEIPQNWKYHSPAMREVITALAQGRLVHDGSPLMRECLSNVVAQADRHGNTVPDRENESKKIDLAVALLNAMYRAMLADITATNGNPYDERGLVVI